MFKLIQFRGDVYLLCKLLLARDDKRVYNIREKAFAKILSKILAHPECTADDILTDFEQGDMSATSKKVSQFIIIGDSLISFWNSVAKQKRTAR